MRIGGLQKLTLLDFPGKTACTVFLQGCNFRCPFCHNPSLIFGTEPIEEAELFRFLATRQGLLDGVAVSGGEPLLSNDLAPLLERIKSMGFAVKLDTNGSFPARLRSLLDAGLVDYVAMDVKNAPARYAATCGADGMLPAVEESAALLMGRRVPYEFRTTVVAELHDAADFHAIGAWLRGAEQYFLQPFVDSGDILSGGLHAPSDALLQTALDIARTYIPNTKIRGK